MRLILWLRACSISLLSLVAVERETEKIVRTLTPSMLRALTRQSHSPGILPYEHPSVAALVWELKYYANPRAIALASAILSEEILAACEEPLGTPLLVPVPMHKTRLQTRGHNQTELLCSHIAKKLRGTVEYAPQALAKIKETPSQQGLPRAQRLKNVAHSMISDTLVEGRHCLLIDDVCTTGATLQEAARALTEAGAAGVVAIALAAPSA